LIFFGKDSFDFVNLEMCELMGNSNIFIFTQKCLPILK